MLDATATRSDSQAIHAAIRRAARRSEEFRLSVGPAGNGYVSCLSLAEPGNPALAGWLARERIYDRSMDRKCQAAYLIGNVARNVIAPLAELLLVDGLVPRLDPASTSLRLQRYRWRHDGHSGIGVRADLRLDLRLQAQTGPVLACARDEGEDALDALRAGLTGLLGLLIKQLRARSGLSESALWRLVADMTVLAFMLVGRRLGDEERARAAAMKMIKAKGSPLNNKQTGYVEIVLADEDSPEAILDRRWFIARGGCCRRYTVPNGELCTVCVLRPAEESADLLRTHLRSLQSGAAA